MKRAAKIIISAVVITGMTLIMALTLFTPANAQPGGDKDAENTPKEEIIYVKLGADGSPLAAYAVNAFELTAPGAIIDYGDFDKIINLTTTDPLSYSGGRVGGAAPAGRFYYQGNLKSFSLPWSVRVVYLLNGVPTDAKNMAGAAGDVEIKLSVRQNTGADAAGKYFAKNYALQISLPLDADLCANIKADNATIANAGKDKLISFIKLPGADSDYSVTFKAVDFEMSGIQLAGVSLAIDIDFDTDKLSDGFSEFSSGAKELHKGALAIKSGAKDLQNGAREFLSGLEDFKAGLNELNTGFAALKNGATPLLEGSADIKSALDTIRARLAEFDASAMDLSPLTDGSAAIYAAINAISDGLFALNAGLDEAGNAGLWQANENALAQLGARLAILNQNPAANAGEIEYLTGLYGIISADYELLKGLKNGISGNGTEENPGLAAGADALKSQYALFDASIRSLPSMLAGLAGGMAELKGGIDALAESYGEFHGGLSESMGGMAALLGGYQELGAGFDALADGAQGLSGGAAGIFGGLERLTEGTGRFANETGSIKTEIQKRIDETIAPFTQSEKQGMVSFISPKNVNVSSVQFVISTDAIEKESAQNPPPPAEVKKNIWQRFLALFGLGG